MVSVDAEISRAEATEPSEVLTVVRAQRGDVRAFEELYRQHSGRIYSVCLRLSGNPQEADELTQTVFVRAWQKLASFEQRSAFASWLHRLAINTVLSEWRAHRRQRDLLVPLEGLAAQQDPQPDLSAGRAVDLERALAGLPRGARTVFVLHDVIGYSHEEISILTGSAVGTSKAQLHRARQLLRVALDK
jgi:RNA polymerase sigma factor (sigma-70 family)